MLDALALEEELGASYREELGAYKALQQERRLRQRKENILRFVVLLPASVVPGYFAASGLFDGRIKNFILDGLIDPFSVSEFPYVAFESDPFLFCALAMFYGLLAFAFGAAAAGITYFGKKPAKPQSNLNLRLSQTETEYAREQVARGKVGTLFGRSNYSPRVPPFIVATVILILFSAIIYGVVLGH